MTAFDSPDGRALYRAVCASPDDDLPRLVLADYLDETGDEGDRDRAAFVRAQCEQARAPWMSARWRELDLLAGRLLARNREAWDRPLKGKVVAATYARGFVSDITVHSKRFAQHGGELFDAAPVRGVKFVTLRSPRGAVPLDVVLASPHAPRLRGLDLSTTPLGGAEVDMLGAAGAGPLAGLGDLTLGSAASDGWAGRLAGAVDRLPALTRLDLTGAGHLATSDLEGLARAPGFARVTALSVAVNGADRGGRAIPGGATAAGVRALFAGPPGALRDLRLALWLVESDDEDADGYPVWPDTDPAVVAAVASAPRPAGLRRLTVTGVSPAVVAALAAGTALAGLEELDLPTAHLAAADLDRLLAAPFIGSVRVVVANMHAFDPNDPASVAAFRPFLVTPPTEGG